MISELLPYYQKLPKLKLILNVVVRVTFSHKPCHEF